MDDHCSTVTKREGGGQDIFLICLMVNNSTFIAYYSCSVGQICLAIQHFHDITEATEVVKVCISPWRDMDAICCPVLLWSLVDAKLDASLKAERDLPNMHLCTVPKLDCFGCCCSFCWGEEGIWGTLHLALGTRSYLCLPSSQMGVPCSGDLSQWWAVLCQAGHHWGVAGNSRLSSVLEFGFLWSVRKANWPEWFETWAYLRWIK